MSWTNNKHNYLVILILLLLSTSCQKQDNSKNFDKNFVHTVYFWLNEPANQKVRSTFETSIDKFLKSSIYAKTKFVGKPANTPRDVVDNSYTYALVLTFSSREDQDLYQEEEAHQLFIKEISSLIQKIQVYDAISIP